MKVSKHALRNARAERSNDAASRRKCTHGVARAQLNSFVMRSLSLLGNWDSARAFAYDGDMKFTKMHGIGNDYVSVNGFDQKVPDPSKTAQLVADRHLGIGGDGLILILPSTVADVRMRMFNADGSEAEMCGNGIRCLAKYAFDHGLSKNNPMR